jgi:hypothetical protein
VWEFAKSALSGPKKYPRVGGEGKMEDPIFSLRAQRWVLPKLIYKFGDMDVRRIFDKRIGRMSKEKKFRKGERSAGVVVIFFLLSLFFLLSRRPQYFFFLIYKMRGEQRETSAHRPKLLEDVAAPQFRLFSAGFL